MDEKKKILILGTLFVVIIGIGGFQFIRSGDPAPAATATTPASGDASATTSGSESGAPTTNPTATPEQGGDVANGSESGDGQNGTGVDPALVIAAKLNPRDPFDGRKWDRSEDKSAAPVAPPKQAPVARAPRGISGGGFRPLGVGGIEGVLPEAGGIPAPGGKLPSVEDFPYTVSGTMTGNTPLVVLTDQAGKQKIVAVGGHIDGDSEVVSISNGKVTVRHRGKTKTMSVGGTSPSNNKQEDNQ